MQFHADNIFFIIFTDEMDNIFWAWGSELLKERS